MSARHEQGRYKKGPRDVRELVLINWREFLKVRNVLPAKAEGVKLADEEDDWDLFDTGECTDPITGTYIAYDGEIEMPCPDCGKKNIAVAPRPTNKIPYHCLHCGGDFIVRHFLIPIGRDDSALEE